MLDLVDGYKDIPRQIGTNNVYVLVYSTYICLRDIQYTDDGCWSLWDAFVVFHTNAFTVPCHTAAVVVVFAVLLLMVLLLRYLCIPATLSCLRIKYIPYVHYGYMEKVYRRLFSPLCTYVGISTPGKKVCALVN